MSYGIGFSNFTADGKLYFAAIPSTFGCGSTAYDVNDTYIDNGSALAANKWYHVVVSFADSVEKIYVNGSLKSSVTRDFKTLNKCSGSSLMIGGWWQNDIVSLKGSLDEIRIYNRTLTQDEINLLAKPVL